VDTFGVLKLTLHPAGYDWNFVPEAGAPSPTPDPAPAIERRTYRGPLTWQPGRTSWVPCKGLPHAGRCPYSSLVLHAGATRSWWVTRTRSNGGGPMESGGRRLVPSRERSPAPVMVGDHPRQVVGQRCDRREVVRKTSASGCPSRGK
jgi:hypothetical protein